MRAAAYTGETSSDERDQRRKKRRRQSKDENTVDRRPAKKPPSKIQKRDRKEESALNPPIPAPAAEAEVPQSDERYERGFRI